jgi:hypothetical protein
VGGGLNRAWVEAARRTVDSVPAFQDLMGENCYAGDWRHNSDQKPLLDDRRIPLANTDLSDQVAGDDRWRIRIAASVRRVLANGTLPCLTVDMNATTHCGDTKGQDPDAQGPNDAFHSDQGNYIRYW